MAGVYPSSNDRDFNLLSKICKNTAGIADLEAGDVAKIVAGTGVSVSPAAGTGTVTITNSGVTSVIGTANQIAVSSATGDVTFTIPATFIAPGSIASTTTIKAGSTFNGLNAQTITGNASGAWTIAANGTNQSITLTPSGTGMILSGRDGTATVPGYAFTNNANGMGMFRVAADVLGFSVGNTQVVTIGSNGNLLLGGLTTNGTGVLQLPNGAADATSGISMGTTLQLFRRANGVLVLNQPGGNAPTLELQENGTATLQVLTSNGNATISTQVSGKSLLLATGTGTTALTLDSSQNATFAGAIIGAVQALSGAGAVNVTQLTTAFTSTGGAQALTLANGSAGQIKTIVHVVDGGSGVLTPTTKTGFSTITFTNAGDAVTLQYFTTQGWCIVGIFGAVAA